MEKKGELSGIERELVLKYLMDGNVPVTITPLENENNSQQEKIQSLNSSVFPIALKPEHINVQKDGKIYLENPSSTILSFGKKEVKVEFYFNRVGLYFITKVLEDKDGLYLLIPESLNRIKDLEEKTNYDFSAIIYYGCNNQKEINTMCIPWDKGELFTRPAWKSIILENQKLAKEYLEEFVEKAKIQKNAGNGLQLIPVCNYLTFTKDDGIKSLKDRKEPFSILFVDHERIVLGYECDQINTVKKFKENYLPGTDFGLKLTFSLKNSPILSRDIYVTCGVNNLYADREGKRICIDFVYTTIQEEDIRYLYEKATKRLFI